jgi:hypothetical protein
LSVSGSLGLRAAQQEGEEEQASDGDDGKEAVTDPDSKFSERRTFTI